MDARIHGRATRDCGVVIGHVYSDSPPSPLFGMAQDPGGESSSSFEAEKGAMLDHIDTLCTSQGGMWPTWISYY